MSRKFITIAAPDCPRCSTSMNERRIAQGLVQSCPRCRHNVVVMIPFVL